MKYCPFCGSGLQDAMVFCPKCGKRFLDAFENPETIGQLDIESSMPECPEVSTQGSASTQVVDDASEADSIPPKEPARQPVKRSTKTGLVLLSAIFVFAVIAFIFFEKNDNKSGISITDAANSVLYLEVCDDEDNVIATASGFIIEEGTTLITNYHVIDGAHHIIAYTPDGEESVEIHTVLAYDEDADLAILECEENIGVQPLLLGDSDAVKQGDKVYAVGYPLGVANTLSDGVVSSRYLDEYNTDILQITAAISSGSSGGALFNEAGQVIGVICASYIDGQNLNIAISSNTVKELLEKPTPSDLADFYTPIYTVDYVIEHFKELDEKDFYIDVWVSTNRYWHNSFGQYVAWIDCVNDESAVYYPTGNDPLEFVMEDAARLEAHKAISVNYQSTQPHEVLEMLEAGQRLLVWGRVNLALCEATGRIEIVATDFLNLN